MRDLGNGPRGVAVFLSIAFASRLDDNRDYHRPATRKTSSAHISVAFMMCLFYVYSRRATSGETSSGKVNKTIIAVIRLSHGSANFVNLQLYTFTHHTSVTARLYSTSLNNYSLFAKAVDFALVVALNCRFKNR